MSATRLLLQSARLSIFQSTSTAAIDVKGWIANQGYFIDVDLQKDAFTLRVADSDPLIKALGNDLNRMAIATFESAAGVRSDEVLPRSMAWGAIRAYYASFFAAHTLMRLFGVACSQLDHEHTSKIFQSAQIFGKTGGLSSIESGFYAIEMNRDFTAVKFRKLKDSHRDTWAELLGVIQNLENAIPGAVAISAHKITASNILTALKEGISTANSQKGNWLSTMRNSINYRHTHGTWFPYSSKASKSELLEAAARNWLKMPSFDNRSPTVGELENFFDVSTMLVSVTRELLTSASELSNPLDPAIKNGCLKLLNSVKGTGKPAREVVEQ